MLLFLVHMSHNHYPLNCDICSKECANLKVMAKHKYDVHRIPSHYDDSDDETDDSMLNGSGNSGAIPIKVMYEEVVWVDCGLCTDRFCSIKTLKFHRETCHKKAELKLETKFALRNFENCLPSEINQSANENTTQYPTDIAPTENSIDSNFSEEHKLSEIPPIQKNETHQMWQNQTHDCPLCLQPFLNRNSLKYHTKRKHISTDSFVCEHCSRRYPKHDQLKRHIENVHVQQLYKCNECEIVFPNKGAITMHTERDHNGRLHQCKICFKAFHRVDNLKSHTTTSHNDSPEYIQRFASILMCNWCLKIFDSQAAIDGHRKSSSDSNEVVCQILIEDRQTGKKFGSKSNWKLFKCAICVKKFICYESLKKHIFDIHIESKFKCTQCDQLLLHQIALDKHNRENHDTYECHRCQQHFCGLSQINAHKSACHRSLYRCTVCLAQLKNRRSLVIHQKLHNKQFECDLCAKKYVKLYDLYNHMQSAHIKSKTFLCDICSLQFNTKVSLAHHMSHHQKKITYCTVCSKPFLYKHNLVRHMLAHNNQRYVCTKCSASYSQSYALKLHMLAHDGIVLNQCENCGRSFQSANLLKKHGRMCSHMIADLRCDLCPEMTMRTKRELGQHRKWYHPGVKSSACKVCKTMIITNNMKKHLLVHTGEKAYPCGVCPKRFAQKTQLDLHMFVHTRQSKHVCSICERKFPRAVDLERHGKSHAKRGKDDRIS